jgi:hypothetical protein
MMATLLGGKESLDELLYDTTGSDPILRHLLSSGI